MVRAAGGCHDALVPSPILAQQQAQLLGLDDAGRAAGMAITDEGVGDVAGHPLLIGEPVADGIDHPRDAPETVQPAARQIGHVRYPAKRYQVVRAHAVHGDAANHHHVAARVVEAIAQRLGGVELVATEQAALPQFAHAADGSAGVRTVGGNAAGTQQIANGAFERGGVECPRAGDADAAFGRRGVVAIVGHEGSHSIECSDGTGKAGLGLGGGRRFALLSARPGTQAASTGRRACRVGVLIQTYWRGHENDSAGV